MKTNVSIVQPDSPKYSRIRDEVVAFDKNIARLADLDSFIDIFKSANSDISVEVSVVITLPMKHPDLMPEEDEAEDGEDA
jgi:hypothetical protein